ncbi:TetR/AcrR family transcriptional regulator [Pseudoroseomonas globiformis]|uniref:TetR/AcrR family transcriptional regulator n=1 Tax=Teichococcus globiformis TaxID=2307229 RepID=A0ABV7FXU0_9PROT
MTAPEALGAILARAEMLMRSRGYAAFSMDDLAAPEGLGSFLSSQEALGLAVVRRYREGFTATLRRIEVTVPAAPARLRAYAHAFTDRAGDGLMPLCCALLAERSALPASLQEEVADFFREQLGWLAGIVAEGLRAGTLRHPDPPEEVSLTLLDQLEGGSLIGWALRDPAPVLRAFESYLAALQG